MKKLWLIVLCLIVLAGCGASRPMETTAPSAPAAETQPEPPSLVEQGRPWDEEGVLLELPVTTPEGMKYTGFIPYDGDMLLWYLDSHLEGNMKVGLLMLDLQTGLTTAQTEISVTGYLVPQVLGDQLYLCDSAGGQVIRLNRNLQQVQRWQVNAPEGQWFVGSGDILYYVSEDQRLMYCKMGAEDSLLLLEDASEITIHPSSPELSDTVCLEYYDSFTGAKSFTMLDLHTGTLTNPPFEGSFYRVSQYENYWLASLDSQDFGYYLQNQGGLYRINAPEADFRFLPRGRLLRSPYDGQIFQIYDTQGQLISQCRMGNGDYYPDNFVWMQEYGGYIFQLSDYESHRILFWDISKSMEGENLPLEPVPEPSEQMKALRKKADAIEQTYGVDILLGQECATEHFDFTVQLLEDYEPVSAGLTTLENALAVYPEGFFRQLHYDSVHGIQIQLVGELTATDEQRRDGSYCAFVDSRWDREVLVANVYSCSEDSYHHEISHVIDSFLEYHSTTEEEALFSEDGWASHNPTHFDYAYDYSVALTQSLEYGMENYFIDIYSTVSPTEDRARVFEYAMGEYGDWVFREYDSINDKLSYYCRCIRNAFDTSGWPEELPWEQYLD